MIFCLFCWDILRRPVDTRFSSKYCSNGVRTKMQNSFQSFYQSTSEPNFQLKSQMINLSNPNVCNFVKKVILFAFTEVLLRFFFEKCQIFGILRKSHYRSKLKLFVIKSMQNWALRCSDSSHEKHFAFNFFSDAIGTIF